MYHPLALFLGSRAFRAAAGARLPVAALALGVALLLASLSVMNGFEQAIRERVLGLTAHLVLQPAIPLADWQALTEKALQYPGVEGAAPFVSHSAMLWAGGRSAPALVRGVEPSREGDVSALASYLPPGALTGLSGGEVLLGRSLAKTLGIRKGDALQLLTPGPGRDSPRVTGLRVRALFHSGTELDTGLALVGLEEGSALAGHPGAVHGLRLKLAQPMSAPALARQLQGDLQVAAQDWTLTHSSLFAAVRISRRLVALLLFAVLAIAGFSVVSSLLVTTGRRRGELALLRSLGASRRLLFSSVLVQGAWTGLAGAALGAAGGALLSACLPAAVQLLERMLGLRLLESEVYPLDYLPAVLAWQDLLLAMMLALLVCLPAIVYPAWRASRQAPAEALRQQY